MVTTALIIGANRGLGLSLVKHYAQRLKPTDVFATVRGKAEQGLFPKGVNIIENVDASKKDCGQKVVEGLQGRTVDHVWVVAGLLKGEEFGKANWDDEIAMYTICAIAPVFMVEALTFASSLSPEAKIIMITSEAGSVTLRTEGEGGGMFAHHGSKAAGNMVGHLLSYDLKKRGVPLAMIHPGFLKTEMTKDAGMEQFYDKMGAMEPDEAAPILTKFADGLNMEMTGKFWAPNGARGIGNAEEVMGKEWTSKPGPLELPW